MCKVFFYGKANLKNINQERSRKMPPRNRVFVIILDSLGIGAMPDSEAFGDVGVDTFGHIADTVKTM